MFIVRVVTFLDGCFVNSFTGFGDVIRGGVRSVGLVYVC